MSAQKRYVTLPEEDPATEADDISIVWDDADQVTAPRVIAAATALMCLAMGLLLGAILL